MRMLCAVAVLACGACTPPAAEVDAGPTGGGATTTGGGTATGGGGGNATGGGSAATGGGGGPNAEPDAGLPAGEYTFGLARWLLRSYDLVVPPHADGGTLPLILALHPGGANRAFQRKLGCPVGAPTSPECFERQAAARGFVVAFPDGTGTAVAADLRTWNAGGGANGWQCVSANACSQDVDDVGYFTDLLAQVASQVPLDLTRVYVTGFSNGAAMAHRLACQFPQEVSAIVSVAGGNQYSTTRPCTAAKSVLEIHGTADPCWPVDGGPISCADRGPGSKISVNDTLALWRANGGCGATSTDVELPDRAPNDGTRTLKHAYACGGAVEVQFYEVLDGGHTWPGSTVASNNGAISQDFSANEVIVDFFTTH